MRLTNREKILLGVLVFVLFFYLSYQNIVINQLDQIAVLRQEENRIQMELDRLNTIEQEEQQVDQQLAEIKEAQAEIAKHHFQLIDEQEELILLLNEFLLDPEVLTGSLSFSPPAFVTEEDMELYYMDVTLNCGATYPKALELFRSLWRFDHKILIEDMSLVAIPEEEVLDISFTVRFYDLTHLTGEVNRLFMWFQSPDGFKTNPFDPAAGDSGVAIRYVFLDSDAAMSAQRPYIPFEDVAGHWAEEAIHGLGRLGVFPPTGSLNYGPDASISRGEFIIMLDRLYDWPTPAETVDLTEFDDYEELGRFEGPMARAIYSGYLSGFIVGYDDNTLRPNAPISYTEVEFIMSNILNDPEFAWSDQAALIQAETGHASQGLTEANASLTRGEAAYFLYGLVNED